MLTLNKGKAPAEQDNHKNTSHKKDAANTTIVAKNNKENVPSPRASSPTFLRTLSFPMLLQNSHSGLSTSAGDDTAADGVGDVVATTSSTTTTTTTSTSRTAATSAKNANNHNESSAMTMDENSFHYRYGPDDVGTRNGAASVLGNT